MTRSTRPVHDPMTLVDRTGSCWIWNGAMKAGRATWRQQYVVRLVWCAERGSAAAGQLHPTCTTPRCVRPEHRRLMDQGADSFWARVAKGPGCWEWRGRRDPGGYGKLRRAGKDVRASRVAWELTHGPIPRGPGHHGTCVRHRCDNRICVNPAHLFLGTHADNIADAVAKGRMHRKLTPPRIAEILAARPLSPKAKRDFAARFGVTPQAIYQVARHAD